MGDISILLAFSAGFLSFLSPCVLPMVPAYISYLTGNSIKELKEEKQKLLTLYKAFGFVIGFSIIFVLMGASVTTLGKVLIMHKELFRKVGGVLIIIFGIHTMGIIKLGFLYREIRFVKTEKIHGSISSIFLGMAFAAGLDALYWADTVFHINLCIKYRFHWQRDVSFRYVLTGNGCSFSIYSDCDQKYE